MSLLDLQAFLQERIQVFDPNIDVGPGSDADTKIIQPLLRRLGPDPFSVDVRAFIMDRLNQEFPDLPTTDGDGITDLLIKPAELLLDPVVRENSRIRNILSFRDPSTLTLDEAQALGANFFVDRDSGDFSRGKVRVYYTSPQGQKITPANVCTSRSGLGYFPVGIQSISVDEMLFNTEGSLFYFDISVVAEKAGDQYNLDAGEITSISGLSSSVKVTNKVRFRGGVQADDTATYMGQIKQSITERSLVTTRGIATQLTNAFPEMTRLSVVGFNDPEMQRDVLEAESVGPIAAAGTHGLSLFDGLNGAKSRRFSYDNVLDPDVDFTTLMGPPGSKPVGWVVTLHGSFLNGGVPPVQDVPVATVIDAVTLDLGSQVIPNGLSGLSWELRKAVLTLSTIPGGIIFPDSPNGTVAVPDNQVHIGGCTDIHVRGTVLDQASLNITTLSDDEPLLSGYQASSPPVLGGGVSLGDLSLLGNYAVGDDTYQALANAYANVDQFEILSGPGAGIYRVLSVTQVAGSSPILSLLPVPPAFSSKERWRLVDQIHVDLVAPKETRVSGQDLQTIQGVLQVTTTSATRFPDFGVTAGDTLLIESGPDAGEFPIEEVTPFPDFTILVLSAAPRFTKSNLSYKIFRPSTSDTLNQPMVRVSSVELLDQNGQPVGSTVPYARPLGAYSTAFSHPGRGLKFDIEDALLGLVGVTIPDAGVAVSGKILVISVYVPDTAHPPALRLLTVTVTFTGSDPLVLSDIIEQINTAAAAALSVASFVLAVNAGSRLGILGNITPLGAAIVGDVNPSTSAIPALFDLNEDGSIPYLTSFMVRSKEFDNDSSFFTTKLLPPFDIEYDVLQTLDGAQIGFFTVDYLFPYPGVSPSGVPTGMTHPNAVKLSTTLVPQGAAHVQFGSRSFGRARLFFLDPTTFQVGPGTRFVTTTANGAQIGFIPDPATSAQIVPSLPSGQKPLDGSTAPNSTALSSSSTDFVAEDVQIGDVVTIDYVPIVGSVVLADPVAGLAFQTLVFSIAGSPDIALTFSRDNLTLASTDVSRQGVADEINSGVGQQIATIDGISNKLVLAPTASMTIRKSGTANTLLGFSTTQDTNNAAKHAGIYEVTLVGQHALSISPATPNDGVTEGKEQFVITRPGVQRIGTTTMSQNPGPAGLYFADVELISEGTGDVYNIDADALLVPEGYRSDGYYLTTKDSDLTFSAAEDITMIFSKTINEVGTDDSLEDATTLIGQNIRVNYEYSALAGQIQNFVTSDAERVVNESPLTRHLIPYYVRFDLTYSGGPQPADVQPAVDTLIQALFPNQQLQVSDIQAIFTRRGTTSISNPLTLYGVVYNVDRTVTLEKSEDRLNLGRLAAFIPDRVTLTRTLT